MDILIEEQAGSLWAAAVEKGRLIGLEIDPYAERVRFGSIYRAKVKRIDASLDAAFLDLDGENTGILYNRDVRLVGKGGKRTKGGDVAIGKHLRAGDILMVQAKTAWLPSDIDEDLPILEKTPVMTMDIVLHGRYLIATPFERKSRISQRISDSALRKKLQKMLDDLKEVQGCILRKSAAHTQTDLLVRESAILHSIWENIERSAEGSAPALLMIGPDAVQRTLADQADQRLTHIDVTAMDQYESAEEWCNIFAPDLVTKIRPVELEDTETDLALFHERNLMEPIEALLSPYAVLPGGGNIIIQNTAALTAVDVNSGRDRRGALAVNLEAAQEIARQIKLRNLGGVIVIDLLKMTGAPQRTKVLDLFLNQFNDDPCTVQIHGFTRLGLLEVTRSRRTPTLAERISALGLEG